MTALKEINGTLAADKASSGQLSARVISLTWAAEVERWLWLIVEGYCIGKTSQMCMYPDGLDWAIMIASTLALASNIQHQVQSLTRRLGMAPQSLKSMLKLVLAVCIASRVALTHVNAVQDSLCIFERDLSAESLSQKLDNTSQQVEAVGKNTSKMHDPTRRHCHMDIRGTSRGTVVRKMKCTPLPHSGAFYCQHFLINLPS